MIHTFLNFWTQRKQRYISLPLCLALCVSFVSADVLLDDMEGERNNRSTAGGYWFLILDQKTYSEANTELLYPTIGFNFFYAENGYKSDHSAMVKARIQAGVRYPFAGMGFNLDRYRGWYSLCDAECVEFMARGTGVYKLKLRDSYGMRNMSVADKSQEFFHEFSVTPDWQLYRLNFSDFTLDNQSVLVRDGKTFTDVCDSISTLIFVSSSYQARDAGTVIELQVDNIVIRGIDRVGYSENNAPPRMPLPNVDIRPVSDVESATGDHQEGLEHYE